AHACCVLGLLSFEEFERRQNRLRRRSTRRRQEQLAKSFSDIDACPPVLQSIDHVFAARGTAVGVDKTDELPQTDAIEKWSNQDVETRLACYVPKFYENCLRGKIRYVLFEPPRNMVDGVSLADAPIAVEHHLHRLSSSEAPFDARHDLFLDFRLV